MLVGSIMSERTNGVGGVCDRFAYDKEQEELRKSFLTATAGDEDKSEEEEEEEGDLLRVRQRRRGGEANREQLAKEVEETFGKGNEEADRFLRDFVMNRRWVEREEEGEDESSEEDEEPRQERKVSQGLSTFSELDLNGVSLPFSWPL
jgi:hypothetical protein